MFDFSREPKGAARSGDMTIAPRAPVEQPFPVIQRWQRGEAGATPGHAAVASGLVEQRNPVQRSRGEEASHTAIASGLVEREPLRPGAGDAAPGNAAVASGLVERGLPVQRSPGGGGWGPPSGQRPRRPAP